MDSSPAAAAAAAAAALPDWKKALLERKRAKRAAEPARPSSASPSAESFSPLRENPFLRREGERRRRRRPERRPAASISRLLEVYSATPGVRTIRAENILIIETRQGEAEVAERRVPGAAELRAAEVVVYEPRPAASEPEPGRVRRLRHQFDPLPPTLPDPALRMRRCGACGQKDASDRTVRMPEGQEKASGCPVRMPEGPKDAADPRRMRHCNGQEEASSPPLRMPKGQQGAFTASHRSQYVQKIASNSFVVNPRGRRVIEPKETTRPEGLEQHAQEHSWHRERGRLATDLDEGAHLASSDDMRCKESTWPASEWRTTVPENTAWPRDRVCSAVGPQEGSWPALPKGPRHQAMVPKESSWPASEQCATVCYGSREHCPAMVPQEGPRSALPRGWEQHATNPKEGARPEQQWCPTDPKETAFLQGATEPEKTALARGQWHCATPKETVASPAADAPLSPKPAPKGKVGLMPPVCGASLRRNSHNSFLVIPRPRGGQAPSLHAPRWPLAPQDADQVPVTCIDDDTVGPLAPLKVLSPRLEGCDVPHDGHLAVDAEDAVLGTRFESAVLQNGNLALKVESSTSGSEFECAFSWNRYPRVDEIEVIGGYLLLDRSCMSKAGSRRRKKLKISFDDTRLHTMFEYPSENSLVAEEQEVEVEREEEEYASEVDEAPSLPRVKRAVPSHTPNSDFSSYAPKLHSVEGGEQPLNVGTRAPGADLPDSHVMLTPASAGALSDFSSEPALYF